MCGRYAASRDAVEIAQIYGAEQIPVDEPAPRIPNFNVTPTSEVFIVADDDGSRAVHAARWGLIPSWSKDASRAARMINARSETVAEKPAYRSAYRHRRCIVPADGYYEWQAAESGRGKQPFFISDTDGQPLSFAGLYETWESPDGPVLSCTILTQDAQGPLSTIHDRMPVLVPMSDVTAWLDPVDQDPGQLLHHLTGDRSIVRALRAFPVSTAVNKPINNGAHLLDPIGPDLAS